MTADRGTASAATPASATDEAPTGSVRHRRGWDCHAHLFGPYDRYPLAADRSYTPPEAVENDYLALRPRLGQALRLPEPAERTGPGGRTAVPSRAARRRTGATGLGKRLAHLRVTPAPDAARLLATMRHCTDDPWLVERILVDNPHELYH